VAHVPQGGSPTFTFSELSAVHSPVIGSQWRKAHWIA
jgi:hypothetical protein